MPKVVSRHATKIHKGNEGGHIIPLHQTVATLGYKSFFTISQSPAPASNSLSSGRYIYFDLESYETNVIENICLRWRLRNSGASPIQTVPCAYFINRIVIEAAKGTGEELAYIYPEQIIFYYYTVLTSEQREKWAALSNFTIGYDEKTGRETVAMTNRNTLYAGQTQDIYMPIPVAFLHMAAINMKHLVADLRFRIELNSDFVISGTSTDISLDDLHMLIESPEEADFDKAARQKADRGNHHKYVYLDAERLTYNDRTMTAGSEQRWNLDQFVGKCPFLVVFIKPSSQPYASNKSLFEYREVGPDGTFDLENSAGKSLWCQGSPIRESEVYCNFNSVTDNRPLKGCYVIDFSDDLKKSIAGVINQYHQFTGQNDYLKIVFPAVATATVLDYTSNIVVANVANYYVKPVLVRTGETTVSDYALNNTAAIQAGIDAMDVWAKHNITAPTVAVDSATGPNVTITITFDAKDGDVLKTIGDLSFDFRCDSAALIEGGLDSYTVTTRGSKGWVSGNDYQIELFMYKYRELTVTKDGRLLVKDL